MLCKNSYIISKANLVRFEKDKCVLWRVLQISVGCDGRHFRFSEASTFLQSIVDRLSLTMTASQIALTLRLLLEFQLLWRLEILNPNPLDPIAEKQLQLLTKRNTNV